MSWPRQVPVRPVASADGSWPPFRSLRERRWGSMSAAKGPIQRGVITAALVAVRQAAPEAVAVVLPMYVRVVAGCRTAFWSPVAEVEKAEAATDTPRPAAAGAAAA